MIQYFKKNTGGKDYAVGDIHGCFSLLDEKLKQINFNPTVDRLFSVGDLIDRGPESHALVDYITKNSNWFFPIIGNHDCFALDWANDNNNTYNWLNNGGSWFFTLSREQQMDIVSTLKNLPFMIEIETDQLPVGIVHANLDNDSWEFTKTVIDRQDVKYYVTWSRGRKVTVGRSLSKIVQNASGITYKELINPVSIPDVSMLVIGHNIWPDPVIEGNIYHIDTGAFYTNKLTILDITNKEFL